MRKLKIAAVIGPAILLTSCSTISGTNPSFPLTSESARAREKQMIANPSPLERPLIVVSGFSDFGVPDNHLVPRYSRVFGDTRILGVAWMGCHTFDACADRLVAAVQDLFPSVNPRETVEVDVVAVSMGGLVSRYAAIPHDGRRRLNIHRLFTISSPHRGANLASLPAFEAVQSDMRPASPFLRNLDNTPRSYPIYPYVRLGDVIVGARNAAPLGETVWWVPPEDISPAHGFAYSDDRIFLDIALRLRNAKPVASSPRSPLPR